MIKYINSSLLSRNSLVCSYFRNVSGDNYLYPHKYIVAYNTLVWTWDKTFLGANGELVVILDLGSKAIVGHCVKLGHINADDIVTILKKAISDRKMLPPLVLLHNDMGGEFSSKQLKDAVSELNILHSVAVSESRSNQPIESWFAKIKFSMRKAIDPTWTRSKSKAKELGLIDPLDIIHPQDFIIAAAKTAIEEYNNAPHSDLFNLSPNLMEDAFYAKHGNKHPDQLITKGFPPSTVLFTTNDDSLEAIIIRSYKGDVADLMVPISYQALSRLCATNIIAAKAMERLSAKVEALVASQNSLLTELRLSNIENNNKLLELQKQIALLQEQKLSHTDSALSEVNGDPSNKRSVRDTCSYKDFVQAINSVAGRSENIRLRRRVALLLLYVTGLRVTNLLVFKVSHIKDLLTQGYTTVPAIKNGPDRFRVALGKPELKVLGSFRNILYGLIKGRQDYAYIFHPVDNEFIPLNKDNFTKEVNKILTDLSTSAGKFFRSHSFRATRILDLLDGGASPQAVQEILGLRDIKTTLDYRRTPLTPAQIQAFLNKRLTLGSRLNKAKAKKNVTADAVNNKLIKVDAVNNQLIKVDSVTELE